MQLHFIIYQTQNSEMPVQKPGLNLIQVMDGHFIPAEDGQSHGLFQILWERPVTMTSFSRIKFSGDFNWLS